MSKTLVLLFSVLMLMGCQTLSSRTPSREELDAQLKAANCPAGTHAQFGLVGKVICCPNDHMCD
jgi:hypothetical protein